MYVSNNGYMAGTSSTTFSPNSILTRAQAVTILYSMAGAPAANYAIPFTDVPSNAYYYPAVCWAYHFNICSGTSSTTFSPNNQLKLQDSIIFLYKYACLTQSFTIDSTLIQAFSDYSDISAYAYTAMNWAAQYCIVQPDTNNMVYPKSYLSRAKKALFICRYDKNTVGFFDGKKKFSFINTEAPCSLPLSLKNRLFQCVRDHFEEEEASEIIASMRPFLLETEPKCFGMASNMLFDAIGRIDFNKNVGNFATMSSVNSFISNNSVLHGINFYSVGEFAAKKDRVFANNSIGYNNLYENVRKYGPTLFSFYYYVTPMEYTGHTVIIISMTKLSDGSYLVNYYDPNQLNLESDYIEQLGSGYSFYQSRLYSAYYYSSSSIQTLSYLDSDGAYNNISIP